MKIEPNTDFGQRVLRRLREDRIAWLTTTDGKGTPQPRPIWFLWDGERFLIYSRPGTFKLEHIHSNPNVSIHFDGDGLGGDIVVITGEAHLDREAPPANQVKAYTEKYGWGFDRIGMTAQEFADSYSVALRVDPKRLRGH